jgi:hypothetical protein
MFWTERLILDFKQESAVNKPRSPSVGMWGIMFAEKHAFDIAGAQ